MVYSNCRIDQNICPSCNIMCLNYSVLLSLYFKENPDFLCSSLDSIFYQSNVPSEVILVKDGLLSRELDTIVAQYQQKYSSLKVISLPVNQGLGRALNEGLKYCTYDIVARMDTDDIAKPDRFEKQLSFLETHPEIDVVSSWIEEFESTIDNILSIRKLPETPKEIFQYGKSRCPINHPVVMFRKSAVLRSGGYKHFPLFEDYYLWVRMLMNGSKFYNIQESLLYFRTSSDMFKRRGGVEYALTEIKLQYRFYKLDYIGVFQMLKNDIIRFVVRVMPNTLRSLFYKRMLR